jgi:hypothetical protein
MSFKSVSHFVCYIVKGYGYNEKSSLWPLAFSHVALEQLLVLLISDLFSEIFYEVGNSVRIVGVCRCRRRRCRRQPMTVSETGLRD